MDGKEFQNLKTFVSSPNCLEQLKLDSVLAYGFIENKVREVLHDRVDHFYYMDDNHIVKCIVSPYTFPVSVKRLHIRHTPDDVINAVMKELMEAKEIFQESCYLIYSFRDNFANESPRVLSREKMGDNCVIASDPPEITDFAPSDNIYDIPIVYFYMLSTRDDVSEENKWMIDRYDPFKGKGQFYDKPIFSPNFGMVYHRNSQDDFVEMNSLNTYYDSKVFDFDIYKSIIYYEWYDYPHNNLYFKRHHVLYELEGSDYIAIDNVSHKLYFVKKPLIQNKIYRRLDDMKRYVQGKKDDQDAIEIVILKQLKEKCVNLL